MQKWASQPHAIQPYTCNIRITLFEELDNPDFSTSVFFRFLLGEQVVISIESVVSLLSSFVEGHSITLKKIFCWSVQFCLCSLVSDTQNYEFKKMTFCWLATKLPLYQKLLNHVSVQKNENEKYSLRVITIFSKNHFVIFFPRSDHALYGIFLLGFGIINKKIPKALRFQKLCYSTVGS